ncbi:TIR domain-containing protein [Enterovirga rhinocerotis]|uniref:TIR-like protein DUF1863 n=1 Tax=Enterovirga rhinocerotis TaxID=1339210 RepID=A0A4R7BXS5_9HYPH|nr:TIR domain-containing protein [Enterovirga rhinocerotis]TDR90313.1 TIR-like protein DUF1863 [Enterovirga rhinocerotis]
MGRPFGGNPLIYGGMSGLGILKNRRVFFSFHYADIMRVNNVRMCQEFSGTILGGGGRGIEFYDASLWEKKKLEGEEALRQMIRQGVKNTSVVCVLAGSMTWERPWVRYEIARSVINNKGLLVVHINGINHHARRSPDGNGPNPLWYMGIYEAGGRFYLCEREGVAGNWVQYARHRDPVSVPRYIRAPGRGQIMELSSFAMEYDWRNAGAANIGRWIDAAAQQAGRR